VKDLSSVLPLATPVIESYLHHAYQTSIICNDQKTMPWIMSNYIQLYFDGNEDFPVQFFMPDQTGYTWHFICPWLDYQVIKNDTIMKLKVDITDIMIHGIDNGYYLVAYLNEYFIPGKPSYQSKDHTHHFLIYGYNSEKQVFYHLGYNNKLFGTSEVKFSDFEKAFYSNPNYFYHTHDKMYMLRINNNFSYDFNNSRVLAQLKDLLYSNRQSHFNNDPVHIFGLNVYTNLKRIIDKRIQNGIDLKIPPFLLLAEHKKIMRLRLEYLNRQNLFNSLESSINRYTKLEQNFIAIRNMALLYNKTKRAYAMEKVMDDIAELKNEEAEVLFEIISIIENGY
jgi:hypothetical protein